MTAQQALYCFRLDDLAYYPLWQFIDGKILPGMKRYCLERAKMCIRCRYIVFLIPSLRNCHSKTFPLHRSNG